MATNRWGLKILIKFSSRGNVICACSSIAATIAIGQNAHQQQLGGIDGRPVRHDGSFPIDIPTGAVNPTRPTLMVYKTISVAVMLSCTARQRKYQEAKTDEAGWGVMAKKVLILLGTRKGAFIFESDEGRSSWQLRGPFCACWPVNHVIADAATGTIYGGGGNAWFGPAVWKSTDLGATWTQSSEGLAYPAGDEPIKSVWSLAPGAGSPGSLYAGVQPAGLFRSDDGGTNWQHVAGLREHPSRPHWQPGGGGLILHSLIPHPSDQRQMWVGISAGGVFQCRSRRW
jgi:hypothetical protein